MYVYPTKCAVIGCYSDHIPLVMETSTSKDRSPWERKWSSVNNLTLGWVFEENTFGCHNDPQIWCEMRKVTLKRTHDSIMGALPASNPLTLVGFVQLYFNFVQLYFNLQLYLCAKFCWNLWLWLILCKQPIKPAPFPSLPLIRRAEQSSKQLHPAHTMWTSASHIVHPCISKLLHLSASEPLYLAVTCIQFEKIAWEHVDHCWSNLFALLEQLTIACSQLPIAHRAAA